MASNAPPRDEMDTIEEGGVKGVATESSYVYLEIYIGVVEYVQIVCLSRRP